MINSKGNVSDILVQFVPSLAKGALDNESFVSAFSTFYSKHESHYYADITQMVFFNFNNDEESIELIINSLTDLIKYCRDAYPEGIAIVEMNGEVTSYLDLEEKLEKIKDHVDLSQNQKKLIDQYQRSMLRQLHSTRIDLRGKSNQLEENIKQMDNSASERINGYMEKVADLENKLAKTEKALENASNKGSRIYAEFIVILGIFTTIIFATFGGLEISGNIFSNLNEVSTGKLLVFGSLIVSAITLILFLLLNGISKLTQFKLRSCGCSDEDCNHNVFQKHPSMIVANMALLLIFLVGVSLYFFPYEQLLRQLFVDLNFFSSASTPLYILIGVFAIYIFAMVCLFRKKSSQSIDNPENNPPE